MFISGSKLHRNKRKHFSLQYNLYLSYKISFWKIYLFYESWMFLFPSVHCVVHNVYITRLIYNDVTAIKVILFILVVLILTYFFFVILGWVSKLFYFWLDCHFLLKKIKLWHPNLFIFILRNPYWCCFCIFHQVGLK